MSLHIRKRPLIQSSLLSLVGLSAIGFIIQLQWVGYIAIVIFSIAALYYHYPVSRTFKLAIVSLGIVLVATILSARHVAQNFSAYSFTLFLLCALQMTVDIKSELREKGRTRSLQQSD
jgi:signal transduction histidine kinase